MRVKARVRMRDGVSARVRGRVKVRTNEREGFEREWVRVE